VWVALGLSVLALIGLRMWNHDIAACGSSKARADRRLRVVGHGAGLGKKFVVDRRDVG
jgi:hypothetical protein